MIQWVDKYIENPSPLILHSWGYSFPDIVLKVEEAYYSR